MITAQPKGGLGNQMFVIASVVTHAEKMGYAVKFVERYTNNFRPLPFLPPQSFVAKAAHRVIYYTSRTPLLRPLLGHVSANTGGGRPSIFYTHIYRGLQWTYVPNKETFHVENCWDYVELPTRDNIHLSGYFQNLKYFAHNRARVERLFGFNQHNAMKFLATLRLRPQQIVVIHVRRGDYESAIHPIPPTPTSYVTQALREFPGKKPIFVTNDKKWVAEHFPGEIISPFSHDWDDMSLMMLAHNHIIWASSFSWWGAWLARSTNVVAPLYWDAQFDVRSALIPPQWTTLKYQ